ncbi:phosphopantetheine-binding protein [Micromonospora peucetia]|uniref:phosphopantetheine-binding protein n=1 Tax=Micromonospora peucetia TaxID=47871 RepID=UPI0033285C5D
MSADVSNLAAVTDVFEEVLGKRVGPEDNFFKLGGHSLLVVQAIAMLRHTHGLRVPARQFLDQGTPVAIAGACTLVERPQPENNRDQVTAGR